MTLIYIAGPDIFRPDARIIAERQKALCTRYGFTPLHPLDGDIPPSAKAAAAMAIFRANRDRMQAADAIIANLTPFRGPSADPGTVFELGYMIALTRPAVAYSKTPALFRQRTVSSSQGCRFDGTNGRWIDADGLEIEDFGLADNLMIDCALRAGGISLLTPPASNELPGDLGCFELGLQAMRLKLTS